LRSLLPPVHRSEDCAGRLVFFSEGMSSYLPRGKLGMSPRLFRRDLVAMCCPWYCMGRKHERCRFLYLSLWRLQGLCFTLSPVHRSEDHAGRHVFFPEGMISCLPRRKLRMSSRNFCRVLDATCYPWCCMGYRASPWERAGRVADADGGCFCLTADAPARSHLFPRLTGWVLELRDQYPVCQCLWFVLRRACCHCHLLARSLLRRAGVLHLVRLLG